MERFRQSIKVLRNLALLFLSLLVLFTASLTLVHCIPNRYIEPRVTASLKTIKNEGNYPEMFFGTDASQLDNFTDRLMLGKTLKERSNPLTAAMDVNHYSRYWHGYLVFLRPLLLGFQYVDIRYINMFIFFLLLFFSAYRLKQRAGWPTALIYLCSIIAGFTLIVPMSMQFMSVFVIMMLGVIAVCRFDRRGKSSLIYLFFLIGAFTSFMDLLTAPLLTFGVPMLIALILRLKRRAQGQLADNLLFTIRNGVCWGAGYFLTWAAKWGLATIILRRNVFAEAQDSINFRTQGSADYPLNMQEMFQFNFEYMFPTKLLMILSVVLIVWVIVMLFASKPLKELANLLPIVLVGALPYAWFTVLSNHSQIHCWFTYRIQIITLFAFLFILYFGINQKKLANRCGKVLALFKKERKEDAS